MCCLNQNPEVPLQDLHLPQPDVIRFSMEDDSSEDPFKYHGLHLHSFQILWFDPELRNASVENQLLELKETDTRQNLEIRGLESKVSSPKKRMRLIELSFVYEPQQEQLFEWESEINKGLQNEAKTLSNRTNTSASCGVAFAAKEFGSATPRHVSRVPGILPSKQESSDQRHNNPISGNQTMNISGRTFTKIKLTAKRTGSNVSPPRIAKRPRLDAASADPANTTHMTHSLISSSLETLQKSCSDLLTSDRIHALFEETSQLPVLTEEEKSVISKFCVNESLTETFLSVILDKVKTEKESTGHDLLQSLCRVYVGLCQLSGDSHKAHALAYRFLKEDFPEAPKLIMVMVTAWPNVFFYHSPLCKAIHIVSKMKANGKMLDLLSKYLFWDEGDLANKALRRTSQNKQAPEVPVTTVPAPSSLCGSSHFVQACLWIVFSSIGGHSVQLGTVSHQRLGWFHGIPDSLKVINPQMATVNQGGDGPWNTTVERIVIRTHMEMGDAPPRINATDVTANRLNNVIRFQLNPDVYDVIANRQNPNITPRCIVFERDVAIGQLLPLLLDFKHHPLC
ncbi:little elongation complex subunit 1 [Silurus meridionalis]|nr:little elongation complex subunit 1 [Silurus meridionalis]